MIQFTFSDLPIDSAGIALVHSIFNIATTLLLLPFTKLLEKIANLCLPGDGSNEKEPAQDDIIVDKLLLATPSVALRECEEASARMAALSRDTLFSAMGLLNTFDEKIAEEITKNEDLLDDYEDKIGTSLVQISSQALSEHDSQLCSRVLRAINDFERLGDHALNLLEVAKEIHEKKIRFTPEAQQEINTLTAALQEILNNTISIYESPDEAAAADIEPLEQVIDNLTKAIKANHVKRLQKGACTIETGFVLIDLLTNYERVSDHCSNIAVLMIETAHNAFDTHKYLNQVRFGNQNFIDNFEKYSKKYSIAE